MPEEAWRDRRFTARDGLGLHFRDYGDPGAAAVPVLCLGGLTRNARDFDALARRLAGARRVLCLDLRGRGRSDYDPDWRNYRPETYLDDIAQLLALAGLHRVVVIGTSLGGVLAMALAATMPAMLAGAVLNDIGPEIEPGGIAPILAYIDSDRPQPDWESAARAIREHLPGLAFQDESMFQTMARNTYREGEDGLLHFDWDVNIVRPLRRDGGATADLWPFFRGLRAVPLLAFRGAQSDLLSADCFARMARERPDARMVTVPRTGHAPTLAEPECVEALDAFLAAL